MKIFIAFTITLAIASAQTDNVLVESQTVTSSPQPSTVENQVVTSSVQDNTSASATTKRVEIQAVTVSTLSDNVDKQTITTSATSKNIEKQTVTISASSDNVEKQTVTTSAPSDNLEEQTVTTSTPSNNVEKQTTTTLAPIGIVEQQIVTTSAQSVTASSQTVTLASQPKTKVPPAAVPRGRAIQITRIFNDQNAKILRYENDVGPDGSYSYAFETDNGISAQAKGTPRDLGGNPPLVSIVSQGSFAWTSPEGRTVAITYEADENGYRPVGDAIPTPPPVPEAIARALAYIAKKYQLKN